MNIRTKIFLGFASMMVLILSMCVVSIEYLVNIRNDSRTASSHTDILSLAYEIEISLLEASRAEKNYILRGDRGYVSVVSEKSAKIRDNTDKIRLLDTEGLFGGELAAMEKLLGDYEKGVREAGAKHTDILQRDESLKRASDSAMRLQEMVYPVVQKAKIRQAHAARWSEETKIQAISAIVLFCVMVIITGAVMTYYIPLQVTGSIGRLIETIKKIEAGDARAKADSQSGDEMGELGGYFNRMLAALEDTRKRAVNAEKLASLGTLSAGVAHEINNPLTGILTSAHMVLKALPKNHKCREDLEIIISETIRCRDIVRGLLDFSRSSAAEKKPVRVEAVIDKTLTLVKQRIKDEGVSIDAVFDPAVPAVSADENRLEQVFLNITLNALEAMKGGGRLSIRAKQAGGFVNIEFSDTGCGIPEKNINAVFDPFFTTKEAGQGTGLGLAVSYGIIKEFDGQISIESAEGKGTMVTIKLPLSGGQEAESK